MQRGEWRTCMRNCNTWHGHVRHTYGTGLGRAMSSFRSFGYHFFLSVNEVAFPFMMLTHPYLLMLAAGTHMSLELEQPCRHFAWHCRYSGPLGLCPCAEHTLPSWHSKSRSISNTVLASVRLPDFAFTKLPHKAISDPRLGSFICG